MQHSPNILVFDEVLRDVTPPRPLHRTQYFHNRDLVKRHGYHFQVISLFSSVCFLLYHSHCITVDLGIFQLCRCCCDDGGDGNNDLGCVDNDGDADDHCNGFGDDDDDDSGNGNHAVTMALTTKTTMRMMMVMVTIMIFCDKQQPLILFNFLFFSGNSLNADKK